MNPPVNSGNINSEIAKFFLAYGDGYVHDGEDLLDTYLPWPPLDSDIEEEEQIDFIINLTEFYSMVGPEIYKGQTIPNYKEIDAEVGDDHIFLGDAPLMFVAELITVTRYFSVNISLKDTFISDSYGNYSESFILKPNNISELYQKGTKPTEGGDSVFLDIAKIRTILPVCSMRQKHSDTVDGKVSLLGKQSIYGTKLCQGRITLAQCLQVICLGLNKEKKFPFLPTFLGGFGSPPIFRNVNSLVRSYKTYKNGNYYSLLSAISLAVFETKELGTPDSKQFLAKVKGDAESWQDWYKVHTKYTPRIKGGLDPETYKSYLGTLGKDEIWDSAAHRLLSAGLVASKTQLLVHDHMEDLTRVLLSPLLSLETREVIELEKRNQRQSSIFNPNLRDWVQFKVPVFLEDDYLESVLDLTRGGNIHLKSILAGDEIFLREELDRIKQKGPLIVNLQMLTKRGLRFPLEFERIIREDEREYYNSLLMFLKGHVPIEDVSRELIEDDTVLVHIAGRWAEEIAKTPLSTIPLMVITTDDVKLCGTINKIYPQIVVFRISVKRDDDSIALLKRNIVSRNSAMCDIRFYDDTGSINAWRSRTVDIQKNDGLLQKVKFTLNRFIDPISTKPRRLKENRVQSIITKVDGVFDQSGILHGRYDRPKVSQKRKLKTLEFEYSLTDEDE